MVNDKNSSVTSELSEIPHERSEERPDFSKPLPRQKLNKDLQDELDAAERDAWSAVYDGTAPETTDTNLRYAGYASRVRTILLSAHRYVAYTSDIGESFRPIAHPYMVKGAYAVSWLYLVGDVSHEGYKAYLRNQRVLNPEKYKAEGLEHPTITAAGVKSELKGALNTVEKLGPGITGQSTGASEAGKVVPIEDYRTVMAQRAIFQGLASMGLPAVTIHSIVKYAGKAMKDVKNPKVRTWGPIGLGLAAVPALPYMFDEPVEKATEWVFHRTFQAFGGPEAVGHRPETGRMLKQQQEAQVGAARDKEL